MTCNTHVNGKSSSIEFRDLKKRNNKKIIVINNDESTDVTGIKCCPARTRMLCLLQRLNSSLCQSCCLHQRRSVPPSQYLNSNDNGASTANLKMETSLHRQLYSSVSETENRTCQHSESCGTSSSCVACRHVSSSLVHHRSRFIQPLFTPSSKPSAKFLRELIEILILVWW